MGLGFGDLDCDGNLDILGSNFGDYGTDVLGLPYALGDQATRWLLGQGDGTFSDPGVAATAPSVFGWGNAVVDYDNDGDQDMIYHGGLDLSLVAIADNPGVVLENEDCGAAFTYQLEPLRGDYLRRNVHGVAVGDLNADGFPDMVTASNLTIPDFLPLLPSPVVYGSPLDATASFTSVFAPTPEGLVWTGLDFDPGTLTVEISSADNGNGSASIQLVGSVDLTDRGVVNRGGIGAVVAFEPLHGEPVLQPIVGGSSHLSQHSLEATFGLGEAPFGTLDVLWPGGVRNRLYLVRSGERLVVPEIPCSIDRDWPTLWSYVGCVNEALGDLRTAGIITRREAKRLFTSSWIAFLVER